LKVHIGVDAEWGAKQGEEVPCLTKAAKSFLLDTLDNVINEIEAYHDEVKHPREDSFYKLRIARELSAQIDEMRVCDYRG